MLAPGEGGVEVAAGKKKKKKKKKQHKKADDDESEVAKAFEDSSLPSTEELPSRVAGADVATEVSMRDVLGGCFCFAHWVPLGGKADTVVYPYLFIDVAVCSVQGFGKMTLESCTKF